MIIRVHGACSSGHLGMVVPVQCAPSSGFRVQGAGSFGFWMHPWGLGFRVQETESETDGIPALLSSWNILEDARGLRAMATARGVEREPGHTQKWSTPHLKNQDAGLSVDEYVEGFLGANSTPGDSWCCFDMI